MVGDKHAPVEGEGEAQEATPERLRRIQIALNFKSVNRNSFSLPLWALLLNVFLSGAVPEVGATPMSTSWIWIAACVAVALVAVAFKSWFEADSRKGAVDLKAWYARVLGLHIGLGVAWSIGIWVHWEPSNAANHMLLFVVGMGCAALYGIVRAGDFNIPVAGTLPLFAALWLHFLQQSLWVDTILSVILPLWYIQFLRDSKNGCKVIEDAHTTQIALEQLAGDLAQARDDAEKQRAAAMRASTSKSTFLANMSHELRTPLNAILGFSEIISDQAFGPAAQDRYCDYAADINASGKHLLSLLNDILDVAKIEAGKLKIEADWLDGKALLGAALKLMHDRAKEKGIALRLQEDDAAAARVFADERAFKQIALNLLSNAVKFTNAGHVSAHLKDESDAAVLVVEDTGCGIPQDQIARIFQPFEQIDNRYARANGGTGLGLTLVRSLTDLHGGSCRIDSEEGKGTRVEIRLPHPARSTGRETKTAVSHAA